MDTIPSSWDGKTLGELISEDNGQRAISLTRSGDSFIPKSRQILKENDILFVAANHSGMEELLKKLIDEKMEAA